LEAGTAFAAAAGFAGDLALADGAALDVLLVLPGLAAAALGAAFAAGLADVAAGLPDCLPAAGVLAGADALRPPVEPDPVEPDLAPDLAFCFLLIVCLP